MEPMDIVGKTKEDASLPKGFFLSSFVLLYPIYLLQFLYGLNLVFSGCNFFLFLLLLLSCLVDLTAIFLSG